MTRVKFQAMCLSVLFLTSCGQAAAVLSNMERRRSSNAQFATPVSSPLLSTTSQKHDCDTYTLEEGGVCTRQIKFALGRSGAVFKDKWLVRTTNHEYLMKARAGQRMTVSITSLEKNTSFTITKVGKETPLGSELESDGTSKPTTKRLTTWSSKLPETGEYQIMVGANRGNATYTLKVAVR